MAEIVERTDGIPLFVEENSEGDVGGGGRGATFIAVSSSSMKAAAASGEGALAFAG